jgi:hypothetical protein
MTTFAVSVTSIPVGLPAVGFVPGRLRIDATTVGVGKPNIAFTSNYVVAPVANSVSRRRLNRLSMSDSVIDIRNGKATQKFQRDYQANVELTEASIDSLSGSVASLQEIVDRLVAAEQAAGEAVTQVAALQTSSDQQAQMTRVRDSYVDLGTLTATNVGGSATVTVADHSRHYLAPIADVAVDGATFTGQPTATTIYIYYDDPTLAGGAVNYVLTINGDQAVATVDIPYRHFVGSVDTPATTGAGTVGTTTLPPWQQMQIA